MPSLSFLVAAAANDRHDERIVGVGVALGQLAAARERRLAAERNVGVLGHEQRIEAALLERPGQLGDVDAVVGGKIESTDLHRRLLGL